MSVGPEPSIDLVAVACVVEASLLVASEWSRVLTEYVYPLLKRLNELHPSHQFRLAFVTYGAADTRPLPLLTKRFFTPLSLVTKELRDEPSKLGIGQTNTGSGRGLSVLEGLVAAIELFDILMASMNSAASHPQTQYLQKESRSLIFHILHIAASPPDNVQRPQWNTLQHLDSVSWDSIPTELRKRKINLSLIGLRKVPQFQDLYSSVAGSGVQSPWFNVHAPHILLLAGFPTPQKGIKRQTDVPLSDQSPDTKRQKVTADPISKALSSSPALSSARVPQVQHSQQSVPLQVPQLPPTTSISQEPSSVPPVQATVSVPASVPASTSPSGPLLVSGLSFQTTDSELFEQVVTTTGVKFGQMVERFNALERIIQGLDLRITNAQKTGQTALLPALRKDRALRANFRDQLRSALNQHYHKMLLAKEATESAHAARLQEAGPSVPYYPSNALGASSQRSTVPSIEEHKPTISDSQILAQFWQSRGGTISAPNNSNPSAGPSQVQSQPAVTPEIPTQVQKASEKKAIRSQVSGTASRTPGATTPDTGIRTGNQLTHALRASAWGGTFSWMYPKPGGQVAIEVQVHVLGIFASASDIRTDVWPKNLILNSCKAPVKDEAELSSWLKRHEHRCRVMQFKPNPGAPDRSANEQKFLEIHKFMASRRIFAYAGWQLPSGKFSYNMFIFPMMSSFAGAVFSEGIPDLPGSGNTLEGQPLFEETKTQPSSGLSIHPAILARIQGLEPAKQKQVFAQFMREQLLLRQQQQQQTQQFHGPSNQAFSSLGMTVPISTHGMVANVPAGQHMNANGSTGTGAYNPGGGTVNYEMLHSFMQRSADGSTAPGMSSG